MPWLHGSPAASDEIWADARSVLVTQGCRRGSQLTVFFFYSNRLGCLGSLLVSLALTILLIVILRSL
jgi:hypothetical protein